MKMVFLAAAAMIATPLAAQTTPGSTPPSDPSTMTAPTAQSVPTAPAPQSMPDASMTPPAPPAAPDAPTPPAPPAAPMADAAPAPAAPTGKLPWCRKGQYTACREHETGKGAGVSKN